MVDRLKEAPTPKWLITALIATLGGVIVWGVTTTISDTRTVYIMSTINAQKIEAIQDTIRAIQISLKEIESKEIPRWLYDETNRLKLEIEKLHDRIREMERDQQRTR